MKKILTLLLLPTFLMSASLEGYDKVPKPIFDKMVKYAQRIFPNDYEMQNHIIQKEIENYLVQQMALKSMEGK